MTDSLQLIEDKHIAAFEATLVRSLAGPPTLERAAQVLVRQIFETFRRDVVLARVYVTLPYARLPAPLQAVVRDIATLHDRAPAPTTPVLSLLGTHGIEPAWQDRRTSKGHSAIPLLDARFVDGAPMIARLLHELGVDLKGLESDSAEHARRMAGGFNGLFYVPDATLALDREGRQVIPAQDFVGKYGVKTVFGMGGQYLASNFVTCIVFSPAYIPRLQAERFARVISAFKSATADLARERRFFDAT